jgi:hypothetical protein
MLIIVKGVVMRNKGSLLILVFILILTLSVSAQDKEQKWRNFEVSVTGGMTAPSQTLTDWKDSLGAKTGLHFGGSGGYCFTNMLSAGVYFIYSQMAMKENYGLHFQMYDFGGYAKVAFGGESYFEPYFKVSAGANSVKLPTWVTPTRKLLREKAYDAGLSLGGYAGLLYYTSDYVSS